MSKLNHLHTPTKHKSKKKDSTSHKVQRGNYNLVMIILTTVGLLVLVQAFRWQVLQSEKFSKIAKQQYQDSDTQTAERGVIKASDGTILAVDQPVWNIYATLSTNEVERKTFFENKDAFIATVSSVLGIEKKDIEEKITDTFVYAPLAKGVSTEKKNALQDANIFGENKKGFGLYFERGVKRIYPNGELASHILGFIGKDSEGKDLGQYGVEGFYFGDITGKEGYTYEEKDSNGNIILTAEYEPVLPRSGKDFTLTIKPSIQSKVEKILKEGVTKTGSKSGTAIVMDPRTGEILAMSNFPTYNPNEYWRTGEPWIFKNLAVSDVYEYGSVQKPLTVAIALESEQVKEDFTCNDKTGYLDLYEATGYEDLKGRKIYTWDKGADGLQDFAAMLKNSNNPCIAQTALKVDPQYYFNKLKDFGIGEFIGIGLQEESTSYLKPFEYWTRLDIITASYGQSISATPLQVISAVSTLANHGVRMRPYIISEVSDEKEDIKYQPQVLSTPISKEVSDKVAQMMTHVIDDGGIHEREINLLRDYNIAAKTGTAQVAKKNEAGYEEDKTITTFVGFAPADDPQMIMLVRLQEPKTSSFASVTVVPVWTDIFLSIADDLEITRRN